MRKNVFKIAAFLLGSALVISSCVKTEELDSVKAIREAKAASLTASTNLTDAQTKSLLADLAVKRFNTWMDSVQLVANLADQTIRTQQNAALAQVAIEKAALQLATDKLTAQEQQKLIQDRITLLLKTNPELALLVKDYNSYYWGGTLSTTVVIRDGIYTLRDVVLRLQKDLIDLKVTQGNDASSKISKLAMYNNTLASDSAYLKSNQKTLALLQSAKTDGIDAALVTARTQQTTAYNDYLAKYAAYNKASTAFSILDDSNSEYWTAINDSINASYTTASYGGSLTKLQQQVNTQTNIVLTDKTTLDKYLVLLTDTTKKLDIAKVAYNTAQANLLSAQAAVDAATINGGSSTPTQDATLSAAITAESNANTRLNQVANQYWLLYNVVNNNGSNYSWSDNDGFHSESGLQGEYDYNNYLLNSYKNDLTDYTAAKTILDAATAKIPALRTDYYAKKKVNDDSYRAYQLADIVYTNANQSVTYLSNISTSDVLDPIILDYTGYISVNKADIATDKSNIANIDITTATTTVAAIAAKTSEIAEAQALVDSYTAKAAALKVKIDAAQ